MATSSNLNLVAIALCVAVFCSSYASVVFAHGGEKVEAGKWHTKTLTLKKGDNWNQEECFSIEEKASVRYSFEAEIPVKFNFHSHPKRKDNQYSTNKMLDIEPALKLEEENQMDVPGLYCFDFHPPTPVSQDRVINLRYRIN
ncbi:MAG: hypothetical protein MI808_03420 [Pseudomonadales bacterium]|nr:hypothetical protein [Pseudomonadales bacterium]